MAAPARRHIHRFIWFRRLSPYEVLNVIFSVLGLLSLYFLLEQTRGTFVQAQHLARSVENGAYQSITTELLELHKLYLEHPALRPYFRGGRDIRPDDPNYQQALVLAEYQLDFFDSFWVQSEQMPNILDRNGPAWLSWLSYMKDSFAQSPIMCRHLDTVKAWYTPQFVAFAKAACPKGLISQARSLVTPVHPSSVELGVDAAVGLLRLARIFHQDADLWLVVGETGRARPAQPIDDSIGQSAPDSVSRRVVREGAQGPHLAPPTGSLRSASAPSLRPPGSGPMPEMAVQNGPETA